MGPATPPKTLTRWLSAFEKVELTRKKPAPPKPCELGGATGYDRIFNQFLLPRLITVFEHLGGRLVPYLRRIVANTFLDYY